MTDTQNVFKKSAYEFQLPSELIAKYPSEPRDISRLLILNRNNGNIEEKIFTNIKYFLTSGDALVINETKVMPARLLGVKTSGAQVEILLLRQETFGIWEALVKPARRLKAGAVVEFPPSPVQAEILEELEQDGGRRIKFHNCADFLVFLNEYGHMPLPPYIDRPTEKMDIYRYQTVYARAMGSAAAPTAGLHFTSGLLSDLSNQGIKIARVLLHVGLGTFRPVTAGDIRQHKMHKEYYELDPQTAVLLNNTRAAGKKIIAVGTTVVRTLETVCDEQGVFEPGQGNTDIFIYPGYKFKAVDKIITNFHLPGSSLIMLVAAFAGLDKVLGAYQYAIDNKFRFYSFGDAMMIL